MAIDINRAVNDIVKESDNANVIIKHVLVLEAQARELMIAGGHNRKVTDLNEKITQFISEADHRLNMAKRSIELVLDELKKQDPNHPQINLLQKKLNHIEHQSHRLNHLRERVLQRISPAKNDPRYDALMNMPKPSNLDPHMYTKIDQALAKVFDQNGIVKNNSLQAGLNGLNDAEKHLFLNELSRRILSNEHTQLNISKILAQLPVTSHAKERELFAVELRKANRDLNMEVLQQIHAPTTKLPRAQRAQNDKLFKPAPAEKEDGFQKQVKEAVDGGLAKVKEVLAGLPNEKRMDFILAVRDENERRKTEQAFTDVPVPKDPPRRSR